MRSRVFKRAAIHSAACRIGVSAGVSAIVSARFTGFLRRSDRGANGAGCAF
jgi:hypothetical protein